MSRWLAHLSLSLSLPDSETMLVVGECESRVLGAVGKESAMVDVSSELLKRSAASLFVTRAATWHDLSAILWGVGCCKHVYVLLRMSVLT